MPSIAALVRLHEGLRLPVYDAATGEPLGEKIDLARPNPTMLKRLNDELAVWERRMSN